MGILRVAMVWLMLAAGCGGGDDDGDVDGGDAGGRGDAGVPCEVDPTQSGCPTCEEDPSPAWCATCETDVSLPGCTFEAPSFPGLSAEVEILRDSSGIPHVYASTDADALYGQGYAQASDRLLQMELARRRALGQLSEVLGDEKVDQDALLLRMRFEDFGRANAQRVRDEDPELLDLIAAWVAGVNARIDEIEAGTTALPYGFGPEGIDTMPARWRVVDVFAVTKAQMFGLSNRIIQQELLVTLVQKLFPEVYDALRPAMHLEDTATLPPEELPGMASASRVPASGEPALPRWSPDTGSLRSLLRHLGPSRQRASNNWVIDGRHTDSGRPLLANDAHLGVSSPDAMWPSQVNSADAGGSLDVVGFTTPGTPFVIAGHNGHVAWGITTSDADTVDLFDVTIRDGVVSVGGRGVPLQRDEHTIEVRGGDPVVIEVERVPGVGVLLPSDITAPLSAVDPGHRILLAWTGFAATNELQIARRTARAADVESLDAIVADFELGTVNVVGADADGIAYRSGGLVPDRGDPATMAPPFAVLDGSDPDTWWTGAVLPPEKMPHSRGGARGWIATANNDPFGFLSNGEITDDPWYYGYLFDIGCRIARIDSELDDLVTRGSVTTADMEELQLDTHSVFADHALPLLDSAWDNVPTDEALAEYRDRPDLERLHTLIASEWDRRMSRGSAGALAFDAFLYYLTRLTLADDLSTFYGAGLEASGPHVLGWALLALEGRFPGSDALVQEGRDPLLLAALDAAAGWLTDRFGGVDPGTFPYAWGDLHGVTMTSDVGGDLDVPWQATDGGDATVDVANAVFPTNGDSFEHLESTHIPVWRTIYSFDPDGTPRAETNFPLGVVGDPASPWFDDMHDDWIEGRYRPLLFRRSEIDADVAETITLSPP